MRAAAVWLVALGCVRPGAAVRPPPAPLVYDVRVEPGAALEVTLSLPADVHPQLTFARPGRVREIQARGAGREATLRIDGSGAVRVPGWVEEVRYRYPLGPPDAGRPDLVHGAALGGDAVVSGKAYLLRPLRAVPQRPAHLVVSGAPALLPWEPVSPGRYTVHSQDLVDAGFHAFGGRRCERSAGDATVAIALLGPPTAAGDGAVCDWIGASAREVLTVRSRLPYPRVTVVVVPVASFEPSPFGMMQWSNPPSMALLTGADAPAGAFASDWVAVHEFLHLTHPSFRQRARWLSEGVATYFTELARMRSGRVTAERGWGELCAGFRRGRDAVRRGDEGGYLATYWRGALALLAVDLELRAATGGCRSLDDALERLTDRQAVAAPEDLGGEVDALAGRPIWAELTARQAAPGALEAAERVLARVGVTCTGSGALLGAQGAALREALTTGDRRCAAP